MYKEDQVEIRQGAQINKIGAEVCGEEDEVGVASEMVTMVDLEEEDQVVEDQWVDVVEEEEDLIPWPIICAVSVAIWPVIVPIVVHSHKRWLVVVLALSIEVHSNLGNQAQREEEAEEGKFGSGD